MTRNPNHPETLRNITRTVGEQVKGWQVRFTNRALPRPIQCFFGDSTYGGEEGALAEAKAFRDKVVALHPPVEARLKPKANRRHTYGGKPEHEVGLNLHREEGRAVPSFSWRATAWAEESQLSRGWAIRKWGYSVAFWKAAAYRNQLTQQPLPESVPLPTPELIEWARGLELPLDITPCPQELRDKANRITGRATRGKGRGTPPDSDKMSS